jgi:hypothetical protein
MDTTTFRAQAALNRRAAAFGPVRCACRAFGTWMRDGATLAQALRVAAATWRAHA